VSTAVEAVWFDLYGTLVDLGPLVAMCDAAAAGRGTDLASRWRQRQLEASWLTSLMGRWRPFDDITADALAVAADELGIRRTDLPADLETAFERLPATTEALSVLAAMREAGIPIGVLSNGSRPMIERTLRNARLDEHIDLARSVDEARRYKPDPAVYALAVQASGRDADRIGFVTANGWDASGGAAFGLRVAWLRPGPGARLPAVATGSVAVATWSTLRSTLGLEPEAR
jgi:2-haloacid dehalogenase